MTKEELLELDAEERGKISDASARIAVRQQAAHEQSRKQELLELYEEERRKIAAANTELEAKQKAAHELALRAAEDAATREAHKQEIEKVSIDTRQKEEREQATRDAQNLERTRNTIRQEQENRTRQEEPVRIPDEDLGNHLLSRFPVVDSCGTKGQYLLLRDGTLVALPNIPHRQMWAEFIDMTLFLMRSRTIRVFADKFCVSAEMFEATVEQRQRLLQLFEKIGRMCLQRFVRTDDFYRCGNCIEVGFTTSLRAADVLNRFLS